ncbi:MAG: hypothetical protein IJ168_07735 [Eubacterium sp.]|nr:hypothetical protein [Eubacterium sp.]
MKKILSLLLSILMVMTVLPSFSVSAYADGGGLGASSTTREGYTYSISVRTTDDADGWNAAYFRIAKSEDDYNQFREWDIKDDIDNSGEIFYTEYTSSIFYDKLVLYVDFGGGVTWRNWSGAVTVKINDVNVWSANVSASSSAGSSSNTRFDTIVDKPQPSSFDVYLSKNESGEKDRNLKFVQSKDDAKGEINGNLYWEIIDDYNAFWKAPNDSPVSVESNNVVASVQEELSKAYKLAVKSNNGYDHTGTITLTAGSLSKDYDMDFVFWHSIDVESAEHGTVTVSEEKAYAGDTVTLTTQPQDGYALKSVIVTDEDGNEVAVTGNKFTMPNSDIKVTAAFEPTTYIAKFVSDGKTVAEIPYTVETAEIEEPAVPEKPGYTGAWSAYTLAIGGVVVEAKYEKEFHDFRVTASSPATCTEEGYDTYTCTICGESYNVTTTPATGHVYKVTSSTAATCTAEGYDTYTCEVCGATYNKTTTPALGHAFTVKIDTVAATCTEEGYEVYQCERCDATYERVTTPATGHVYKVTASTPATCTTEGYDTYTCTICGDSYHASTTPATGHVYNVTDSTPATCTAEGYDTYTCEICGATYNKTTTPVAAHLFSTREFKDATCTEPGYTVYECLNCGTAYRGDFISAKDHHFAADVVAPTCAEEGYTYYTCEVCGETRKNADGSLYQTNIKKPVAHVLNTVSTVAPTCGEDGKKVSECINCGYVQEEVIPATGDHWYTAFMVTEPTCAETGVMAYMCANCDALYYEELPVTGDHNYDGTMVIEDADNYRINPSQTCTVCGQQEALVLNGWCKHPEIGRWMFLENNAKRRGWLHIPEPFDQWYYLDNDGYMVTGLYEVDGKKYYFDEYGVMQTGWYHDEENDAWYYADEETGAMVTGWNVIDERTYYFGEDAVMLTGWQKVKGKWYYLSPEDGSMQTGWQKVDGKWYYLDPDNGDMKTSWQQIDGKWYYLKASGEMATGWLKQGSTWYYLNVSGAMATGWKAVDGKWYYFDATTGAMKTGWQKINKSWYYLSTSGAMVTGWRYIDGAWYYFNNSGSMRTASLTENGKVYRFAASGKCLNP